MKKQYHLFFILGLFFFACSEKEDDFSEKNISDSLSTYLSLANEDTIAYESRLDYNKRAFDILLKQENDSLNRKNLFKVANRYFNLNNFEEYFRVANVISKNSLKAKDNPSIAKAYSYLGDYYANTTKKDSAFFFYTKAEKLFIKLKDNANLGNIYVSMAIVKNNENDFLGSELSAVQALNILRGTSENAKIYEAYNILGVISYGLKDYEKSIEYHSKALKLAEEKNLSTFHEEASSLNNLGSVYQELNKHELAISKFKDALTNKQLFMDKPNLYATLIDNLAYSKFKLKDNSQLPDLFYQALKIRDSLNITSGIIYTKIHLSEYFAERRDSIKSQHYADEALDLSKKTKNYSDILLSLKQLVVVEPKNASIYSDEYIKINDSLHQAERKSKERFARIEFETDEYILQNDKLTEQNRNILVFSAVLLLFGTLLFIIKNQRTKTKELLLKQAQQKANEDIYNLMLFQQNKIEEGRADEKIRIAQELHDGILGRLFGARLNLDTLNNRQGQEAIYDRKTFLTQLKSIEEDIREISHELSREKNEVNNNFIGIVHDLIEQQEKISEARVDLIINMEIQWEKVENSIKINLYRILQEALQNSNKYAQAKNIKVEIVKAGKALIMAISDDGIGFSVTKKSKGIGLRNMISRADACGGILEIKSKAEKGTSIIIKIPIETPKTTQTHV